MTTGRRPEDGATLIEVLIAVMILGVAVVAFIGALGTGVVSSDVHRRQATAETAIRRYAEAVKARPFTATCPTTTYPISSGTFSAPAGFTASVPQVRYVAADNSITTTCSPTAVQVVTVAIESTDGKVDASLDIVKRRP
jgi:Tfp pilus assembly protein PilV